MAVDTELREGYAEIGDERLHHIEAGEGRVLPVITVSSWPNESVRFDGAGRVVPEDAPGLGDPPEPVAVRYRRRR